MTASNTRSRDDPDDEHARPRSSSGADEPIGGADCAGVLDTGRLGEEVPGHGDLQLATRARRGEAKAIQEFLGRMACVRRFLVVQNKRLGHPLGRHELEDLAQETLLALWQKLDRYRGVGRLEAWAFRFAYLRVLGRVRSLDYRPRLLDDLHEEVLEPQAPPAPDIFRFEALYRGLERVSVEERRLVQRRVFEHRSFEDLEEEFSAPAATLKTRFYRTVARLRTWMGAEAPAESRADPTAGSTAGSTTESARGSDSGEAPRKRSEHLRPLEKGGEG